MVVVALFALLFTGVSLTTGAAPAQAHATVVSSSPEDGTEVAHAPAAVSFTFDQAVRLSADATQVTADDGHRVDLPPTTTDGGTTVEIPLRAPVPRGAYTASYRVVSADGHVVSGAIRFGVGVAPVIEAPHPAPADPLTVIQDGAQGLVYLGVILLVGVGLISVVLWPFTEVLRRIRMLRMGGWVLLVVASLLRIALIGPIESGTGLDGVVTLSGIGIALSGIGGIAIVIRLGLLVVLLPLAWRPTLAGRGGRIAGLVLAAGLLVTVAADGHATDGADAVLATAAATAHLAAMAVWLGGLTVLLTAVLPAAERMRTSDAMLRRWSVLAFTSVVVLIVTGEYQAWRQLVPLDSLVNTSYGITLLVKIGLVLCAAAAGWIAHRAAAAGPAPPSPHRIRRAAIVEAAITAAVVVATTVLVALPPARTTYGPPIVLTAPAGSGTASIEIDSTRTGVERFRVAVRDADGRVARADSLSGSLTSAVVAAVPLRLGKRVDGTWVGAAVMPASGVWTLQLDIGLGGAGDYSTATVYRIW